MPRPGLYRRRSPSRPCRCLCLHQTCARDLRCRCGATRPWTRYFRSSSPCARWPSSLHGIWPGPHGYRRRLDLRQSLIPAHSEHPIQGEWDRRTRNRALRGRPTRRADRPASCIPPAFHRSNGGAAGLVIRQRLISSRDVGFCGRRCRCSHLPSLVRYERAYPFGYVARFASTKRFR